MSSQYQKGHLPDPSQEQKPPGHQYKMDPAPASTQLPTEDGGYRRDAEDAGRSGEL